MPGITAARLYVGREPVGAGMAAMFWVLVTNSESLPATALLLAAHSSDSMASADAVQDFARLLHECLNAPAKAAPSAIGEGPAAPPHFHLEAPTTPVACAQGGAAEWFNSEPLQRARLLSSGEVFTVPLHWGVVEPGVYRSGFPVAETFPLLSRLGVRTVINFQDRLPLDYKAFLADQGVQYVHAPVKGNKVHHEEMDWGRVSAALALISNTTFHPILVHCAFLCV